LENPGHLIIGAQCGIQIGTGHVMRCLALAQSWKRSGGNVTFLLPEGSPGIEQRIRGEGFLAEALAPEQFADAVVDRMLHSKQRAAVLDGYGFGAREQTRLSQAGTAVLTVDDYGHAAEYPVRWVLNQNAHAHSEMYARRANNTRLLLGPAYALLRDEFLPWLGWMRTTAEKASKILVTIGGSDPDNLSARVLESLALLEDENLQVVLVAGSSNPHLQTLQSKIKQSPVRVRLVQDAREMPALMSWADVAVSAAGGTAYELCYMGLPSLLWVIADNQRQVAERLSTVSAAVHAGAAHDFNARRFAEDMRRLIESPERRQTMSQRGRALVDGLGADRVRAALIDREMQLRPPRETDCELLFSWANDPDVRTASFHSAAVQWEEHQKWFAQKLDDRQSVIYIGETCSGEPIGQVRFHLDEERMTLSVVVAPEFRGTGWGKELITFATRRLARERSTRYVDAFVKPANQRSICLFESAGFRRTGSDQVAGQPALRFTWESGNNVHVN
jgi:UDP-2,4-diacetamido-2,4,6-trideoxy-beta-L-altropyranose hydrolase